MRELTAVKLQFRVVGIGAEFRIEGADDKGAANDENREDRGQIAIFNVCPVQPSVIINDGCAEQR